MRVEAKSPEAKIAQTLVDELQTYFVEKLNDISATLGNSQVFEAVEWGRDGGVHGGGVRYEARDETIFNRASVNVSQVHYDDDETKKLSSATAISTIIHPNNPHVPSMHMHISWTQMREGKGYWRIMGDLNPSIKNDLFKKEFDLALHDAAGAYGDEGRAQGNRYFNIPVLGRTRGVSHFYLEDFHTGDFEVDRDFAYKMGKAIIDVYISITRQALEHYSSYLDEHKALQLDYHTLYLFQVLTLDRGTTSGLLVHDQNDIGIMGSIPSHVNRELLASWVEKMIKPQDVLVLALLDALPNQMPTPVEVETKKKLASAVRSHYKRYPDALSMQASGNVVPPTVDNHQ
ncbi:MAG: Coproporphyrinogen III oxidase, aerobic (EC [uncultured Sulfurovum sp.]|uniref:coproporphyrinogen oxidase n=1 Tax=uncultured Sulfurovum sp. TaxID=269237 RepID=A0A6S6UBK0_9BACT|nr:MAG: Coproporphyrinogen III oxidase, aerobic (EC [uncultured Sulfurovum sp.]